MLIRVSEDFVYLLLIAQGLEAERVRVEAIE